MLKGLKGLLFEDTAPAAKPAQQAAPSIAVSLPPVAVTSAGDPKVDTFKAAIVENLQKSKKLEPIFSLLRIKAEMAKTIPNETIAFQAAVVTMKTTGTQPIDILTSSNHLVTELDNVKANGEAEFKNESDKGIVAKDNELTQVRQQLEVAEKQLSDLNATIAELKAKASSIGDEIAQAKTNQQVMLNSMNIAYASLHQEYSTLVKTVTPFCQ